MSVKSALRVMEILELLLDHPEGLTVKEISDALGFPQSSTFNLVQTMLQNAFLSQNQFKIYKLGPKLIHIGTRAMESLDLLTEAQPYLTELMKRTDETVFLAVLSSDEIVYLAKIDSNRSIRTSAQIGSRKPLYSTGLGKAFLAFMPQEARTAILDKVELKALTPKTVTDRKKLEEQLDSFIDSGYSIDDEEGEEGLFCIAAPVWDVRHQMVAAVSVAGPKERMYPRKDNTVAQLLGTTKKISESVGFHSA